MTAPEPEPPGDRQLDFEREVQDKLAARQKPARSLLNFYGRPDGTITTDQYLTAVRSIGVQPQASELRRVVQLCQAAGHPPGVLDLRKAVARLARVTTDIGAGVVATFVGSDTIRPPLVGPPEPPATVLSPAKRRGWTKPDIATPNPFGWAAQLVPKPTSYAAHGNASQISLFEAMQPGVADGRGGGTPPRRSDGSGFVEVPEHVLAARTPATRGVIPVPAHPISAGEFEALLAHKLDERSARSRIGLRRQFHKLNTEDGNRMTPDEFRAALLELHINPSETQFAQLVRRYDTAGDGTVDLRELDRALLPADPGADADAMGLPPLRLPHSARDDNADFSVDDVHRILLLKAAERMPGEITVATMLRFLNMRTGTVATTGRTKLTHPELYSMLAALGVPLSEPAWRAFIHRHDPGHSGLVELQALARACLRSGEVGAERQATLAGLGLGPQPAGPAGVPRPSGPVQRPMALDGVLRAVRHRLTTAAALEGSRGVRAATNFVSKDGSALLDEFELAAALRHMAVEVEPHVVAQLLATYGDGRRLEYRDFLRQLAPDVFAHVQPSVGLAPPHAAYAAPVLLPADSGYPMTLEHMLSLLRGTVPSLERREAVRRAFAKQDPTGRSGAVDLAGLRAALATLNVFPRRSDLERIWAQLVGDAGGLRYSQLVADVFGEAPAQNWLDVSNEAQQTAVLHEPPAPLWLVQFEQRLREKLAARRGGQADVRRALRELDPFGSGVVEPDNLYAWLQRLYFNLSEPEFRALLARYRAAPDGRVDYRELVERLLGPTRP